MVVGLRFESSFGICKLLVIVSEFIFSITLSLLNSAIFVAELPWSTVIAGYR